MKETLYCSFCGKSQHEVRKLIAGSTGFICDECVALCVDMLLDDGVIPLPFSSKQDEQEARYAQLDLMQFSTLDDFMRKGGVETHEGPYTGREMARAIWAVCTVHLSEARRKHEAEIIRQKLAEINERAQAAERTFEKEREPLRNRLASLE